MPPITLGKPLDHRKDLMLALFETNSYCKLLALINASPNVTQERKVKCNIFGFNASVMSF